jgi:hypothetical protein
VTDISGQIESKKTGSEVLIEPLPEPLWVRMAALAGGLPDEARGDVTKGIRSYGETMRFVRTDVREIAAKALKRARELSLLLANLEVNQEFKEFDIQDPIAVTDLGEARRSLDDLSERLERDCKRLNQPRSKIWAIVEASAVVTTLLEIRTDRLSVDVPTTARDTTRAGPFLEYVKSGLRYADPQLTARQIDRAIDFALQGFQERRPFEPENFPSGQVDGCQEESVG